MCTTQCRYDYYQIILQVNLSEEDSCLFSRYGQSVFSIKKVDAKQDCKTCSLSGSDLDSQVVKLEAKFPDAVILSVDIDRCDCTKATFNLLVRLPCVRKCTLSVNEMTALTDYYNTIASYYNNTTVPSPPCTTNEFEAFSAAFETLINQCGCCNTFSTKLCSVVETLKALKYELIGDGGVSSDDEPVTTINSMLDALQKIMCELRLNDEPNNGVFRDAKFSITSGASGYDRDLVTFYVKPLDPDVVSTGVFEKCYFYEITRVPGRKFDPTQTCNDVTYAVCGNNKLIPIAAPCDRFCVDAPVALVPNTLHITIPLTKDLKCLLPDFNVPGTVANAVLGKLATVVKIVSNCPQKFSFPARMTFDKVNCTTCLEISTKYVCEYLKKSSDHPYNSEYGRFGCASLCKDTKCSDEFNLASFFKNCKVSHDYGSFFALLAMSRKLDVVGVHKCTEKTFFSFQICTVPYKPVCVDICGCKLMTIPDINLEDPCIVDMNSYKVQADCDYTYEFSYVNTCQTSSTTTACPTTSADP